MVSEEAVLGLIDRWLGTLPPGAASAESLPHPDGGTQILTPTESLAAPIWISVIDGGGYLNVIVAEKGPLEVVAPVTYLDKHNKWPYLSLLEAVLRAVERGQVLQCAEVDHKGAGTSCAGRRGVQNVVCTDTIFNLGPSLLHITDLHATETLDAPFVRKFEPWWS